MLHTYAKLGVSHRATVVAEAFAAACSGPDRAAEYGRADSPMRSAGAITRLVRNR
jgi:hypothetical protein